MPIENLLKQVKKIILDATAGKRMMHPNKQNPHVLYIDQRPEVKPDEVQDFRRLPYEDKQFKLVIIDPPHRSDNSPDSWFTRDYGSLNKETWKDDIKQGLSECWRVLEDYGVLVFKWNDHQYKTKHLYPLFPAEPIVQQITTNGTSSKTYWFLFMKIPTEAL
jgi:hypothetical protein